jgi:flagellar biogenesis protein FliO
MVKKRNGASQRALNERNSSRRGTFGWIGAAFAKLVGVLRSARPEKRMKLCESVSLGDKRFLAIVRVDAKYFLVGGSSSSVAMLAPLSDSPASFTDTIQRYSDLNRCPA